MVMRFATPRQQPILEIPQSRILNRLVKSQQSPSSQQRPSLVATRCQVFSIESAPASNAYEDLRFDGGLVAVCFIFTYKKAMPIGEPTATTPVSVTVALTLPGYSFCSLLTASVIARLMA